MKSDGELVTVMGMRTTVAAGCLFLAATVLVGDPTVVGDLGNSAKRRSLLVPAATRFSELAVEHSLEVVRRGRFVALTDVPDRAVRCLEHAVRTSDCMVRQLGFAAVERTCGIVFVDNDRIAEKIASACGSDLGAGHLGGSAGFFSRSTGLIYIRGLAAIRDPKIFERMVAHEVAHEVVWANGHAIVKGAGAWIAEGVATLMEALCPETGDFRPLDMERIHQACGLVAARGLIPLERFVNDSRRQHLSLGGANIYYRYRHASLRRSIPRNLVQGCALILFLRERLGGDFADWLHAAIRDGGTAELLVRYAKVDMSKLEQGLTDWLVRVSRQ